jgi:hypothetical protein
VTDVDEFITQWEHSGPFTPRADDTNNLIAEIRRLRDYERAAAEEAHAGDEARRERTTLRSVVRHLLNREQLLPVVGMHWRDTDTPITQYEEDAVRHALDTP